jgi:hypothetical protein
MASFKQGAVVFTEKSTPVAPSNPGEVTVVARGGSLYKYDGVTETEIGGGGSAPYTYGSYFPIISLDIAGDTLPVSNFIEYAEEVRNFNITPMSPSGDILQTKVDEESPGYVVYVYPERNCNWYVNNDFIQELEAYKYYVLSVVSFGSSAYEVGGYFTTQANANQIVIGQDTRLNRYVGVPATPTSPGKQGSYAMDSNNFYACYSTNNWITLPVGGGGASNEWTSSTPITLAANEEYILTHPTVVNEKILVAIYKDTTTSGSTYNSVDFDLADIGQFTTVSGNFAFDGKLKIAPSSYGTETRLDLSSASILGSGEYGVWVDGNTGTYKGRNAFDDTSLTWLGARSSSPQWIAVDLGSKKNITKVRIRKTNQNANYDVGKFKLQYSDTGLSGPWTDHIDRTSSTITYSGDWYEDIVTTEARYWRLYITEGLNGIHSDGYGCGEFELYESQPQYATSTWNIITTTNSNNLSLENITQITSFDIDNDTLPSGTEVRFLVSFDGRVTWNKYSGGVWTPELVTDIQYGNNIAEVEGALSGLVPSVSQTSLDIAIGFKTENTTDTPSLNGISAIYDEDTTYDIATVGSYSNPNVEFGLRRISPTKTKIKNKTGSTQTINFNVLT